MKIFLDLSFGVLLGLTYFLFINKKLTFYTTYFPNLTNWILWIQEKNSITQYWGNIELIFNLLNFCIKFYREILFYKPYIEFLHRDEFLKPIFRATEIFLAIINSDRPLILILIDFTIHEIVVNIISKRFAISHIVASNIFLQSYFFNKEDIIKYSWIILSVLLIQNLRIFPFNKSIFISIPGKETIQNYGNDFRSINFQLTHASIGSFWHYLRIKNFVLLILPQSFFNYLFHPFCDLVLLINCIFQILGEDIPVRHLKTVLKLTGGSVNNLRPGNESIDAIRLESFHFIFWTFLGANLIKYFDFNFSGSGNIFLFLYNILNLNKELWVLRYIFGFKILNKGLDSKEKKEFIKVTNW